MVTRARHNVTLYVPYLRCSLQVRYTYLYFPWTSHACILIRTWKCSLFVFDVNRKQNVSNFVTNFPISDFMKHRLAVLELFSAEMHTDRRGEEHGRISATFLHWIVVLAELTHHRTWLANLFWRSVPKLFITWELGRNVVQERFIIIINYFVIIHAYYSI